MNRYSRSPVRSPTRGSKPQRSYLDRGPTKEQRERRDFLKGRLFDGGLFDDDDDDDNSTHGYGPLNDTEDLSVSETNRRNRNNTARKMSQSLSPKMIGRKVLGIGRRKSPPRKDSVAQVDDHKRSGIRRSRSKSKSRSFQRKEQRSQSPQDDDSPPPIRRSRSGISLSRLSQSKSRSFQRKEVGSQSPQDDDPPPPIRRSRSGVGLSRSNPRPMRKQPRKDSRSRSPTSEVGKPRRKNKKAEGFESTRKSLLADKARLDSMHFNDDASSGEDETILERATRRVAERRGRSKIHRSATSGADIGRMQTSLKNRKEVKDEEDDEEDDDEDDDEDNGVGLFSRGLKALEKVYSDLNG